MLTELHRSGVDCRFAGTFGDYVLPKLGRLDDLGIPYALDGQSLRYDAPYPVTLALDEQFTALVEQTLVEFRPDIVLAQLEQAREVLALAKRYGCRTALYVLDVEHKENFLALESEPDVILAVSELTRSELRRRFGKESHVLYPLVDFDRYVGRGAPLSSRASSEGPGRVGHEAYAWHPALPGPSLDARDDNRKPRPTFVTMINPMAVKGADIALELAERLPRQEFLFVEGWGPDPAIVGRIERQPNATYLRKQMDMRAVYGRTAVLIVPSQWQEAFGRVVLEAQASGIPVIASRTGGLPEAVGDGGILIDDYRDPDRWLSALQGLLEDPARYRSLSEKAIANTRRFDLRRGLDRLAGILGLSRVG